MVILIGGASHAGKTLMAQKLLEKYHYPYTSIDHIKMGIIRGYKNCGFTPYDSDKVISEKLWGVIKGIVDTCVENKQNIIIEGCYLPPHKVVDISDYVIAVYIVFSDSYINKNFNKIISYENIIEKRKFQEERNKNEFILENKEIKKKCIESRLPYFEINEDYEEEIQKVYNYIHENIIKIRKYRASDLNEILVVFYDTVHEVCSKDYSKSQLNAWADGNINKEEWNKSFLEHYTVVVEIDNKIVGFGDINGDYIDRLYVHKNYQNIGIATKILKSLEKYAYESGKNIITTHVSITAKSFFEERGYKVIKEQDVKRKGEALTNYIMKNKEKLRKYKKDSAW